MEDRSGRLILVALIAALGLLLIIGFAFWPGRTAEQALGVYAALDPSFGQDGGLRFDFEDRDQVVTVEALNDGRTLLVASAMNVSGRAYPVALLLSADGALDKSWGDEGTRRLLRDRDAHARTALLQPDGGLLLAGDVDDPSGGGRNLFVLRLDPSGSLDPEFDEDGIIELDHGFGDQSALTLHLLDDGRILVGGWVKMNEGNQDLAVLRLHPDGRPDSGFGSGGLQTLRFGIGSTQQAAHSLLVDELGEVLALGELRPDAALPAQAGAARFLAAGVPDPTFGERGHREGYIDHREGSRFTTGLRDASGAFLVGGSRGPEWPGGLDKLQSEFSLLRLLPNGTIDPSYKADGLRVGLDGMSLGALDLASLADGRILALSGVQDALVIRPALISIRPDGSLDKTFGEGGRALIEAEMAFSGASLALQALDDRPLVAIEVAGESGGSDIALVRLSESATFGER